MSHMNNRCLSIAEAECQQGDSEMSASLEAGRTSGSECPHETNLELRGLRNLPDSARLVCNTEGIYRDV